MIDLHLHFDGSLPVETVRKQAYRQGIALPASDEALKRLLICSEGCRDLNEYLDKFVLPLSVLQTEESLRESMEDLIRELVKERMLYAELRFAPQSHCQKGLTQREVLEAILEGVRRGTEGQKIRIQLILCCMRGKGNEAANLETVELAAAYLHQGVCACDLAGAEALFPTEDYRALFSYAGRLGVPCTIHAGEADGPKSIRAALSFGAARIGHGVRAVSDPELVEQLKRERICLECCPTSNVQTRAMESIEEHPVVSFLRQGLLVTVNTDNRTVSGTSIAKEMALLKKHCGLTAGEERQLYLNAVEAAFLSHEEREELKNVITQII